MTEALIELIQRYKQRIYNNSFEKNPYYDSTYAERKELVAKIKELEKMLGNLKDV